MNAVVNTGSPSVALYLPEATETLIKASLSENTLKAYQRALAKLTDWLSGRTLTDALFATYITELHTNGRSPATIGQIVAAVKWQLNKQAESRYELPITHATLSGIRREGWDSPNVFQICTLNQTTSEVKKRQEIGRGVRLAVDQSGNRVHDAKVNVLTVIANESYASYVEGYQSEMQEAYGNHELPPAPVDKRKRRVAKLQKAYMMKPEFKALWERIKHKTRYAVHVDTETLINEVVKALDDTEIRPPRITVTKAVIQVDNDEVFSALQMSGAKTVIDLAGRYPLPNLVDTMMHLLENTTPPIRLTRKTLLEIFRRTQRNRQAALDNPHEFASVAARVIKEKLTDQLVDGIKYEKIGECYEMCQFEASIESWKDHLIPAKRSLYDKVIYDSEVERKFVKDLEKRDFVKLYVKLPAFFKVPTPIGSYNPDWAIVVEPRDEFGEPTGEQLLYLVRETKGTTDLDDLRPDERRKIECGKRHFTEALGVDYEVVDSAQDLICKS